MSADLEQEPRINLPTGRRVIKNKPASIVALLLAIILTVIWSLIDLPSAIRITVSTVRAEGQAVSIGSTIGYMIGTGVIKALVVGGIVHLFYWRHRSTARESLYFAMLVAVSLAVHVGGLLFAASA